MYKEQHENQSRRQSNHHKSKRLQKPYIDLISTEVIQKITPDPELRLKSDFEVVPDSNFYLSIMQTHGKTSLFYTTKMPDGTLVEKELTEKDFSANVLTQIIKAVEEENLQYISDKDKNEILKIISNKNTQYEDLFLKIVDLAKDENCPIITLQTIADILTEDPSTIKSVDHANKIVELLKNLDAVDFMELNAALIPQYVSGAAEGEDQGASIFRNETVEGIKNQESFIILALKSEDELSLIKLKQLSKLHDYSPVLIKKNKQVYIYGAENNYWKITELDRKNFKKFTFPAFGDKPFVLPKSEISKEILKEILLKNAHYPLVDYRNILIMGLMKQQIVKEESGDYVRATLYPRFNELAQKMMKRYLHAVIENKRYDLYTDTIMIDWMVESANSYVDELRAIRKAISEVPPGIRANCNLVLESILKHLFPNNQPSKNPYYNNPKKSRLTKELNIPRAAFGLFLLYLNLRLMGLFINEKMDQFTKEGVDNCFTDPELREGISLLKSNKVFNKSKLASLENDEEEIIKALASNPKLRAHFIKKTTLALSKDLELVNNRFVLFLQIQHILNEKKAPELVGLIRTVINTTFCSSVNMIVNDYRLQENTFDLASPERKLAHVIYSRTYQGFSSGYRRVLANLAKKPPAELAKNIEPDQLSLKKKKSATDTDIDTDQAASTSGTQTVTLQQSRTFQSVDSTDQEELDPIWRVLLKRLSICEELYDLERIIQDASDNLYHPKKAVENSTETPAIIKTYEKKTLLSKLFKPIPVRELLRKKSTYDMSSATVDVFSELDVLSGEKQTPKNREAIQELYQRNSAEFTRFFQVKLKECMNGLVRKVVYFRYTFNPFFQFAQKCLDEQNAQALRNSLEETITNHKLQDALKERLKSKEGLKLDEPIPRFPVDEEDVNDENQSWIPRCSIS